MKSILLLLASVSLSSGRGIFSKSITSSKPKLRTFFFYQFLLFLFATFGVFCFDIFCFQNVSKLTILYGLIYGVLLVGAQWLYTYALSKGTTAICAMIYAFGFVVPTLSGFIFWQEEVTFFKIVGICLVIPVVVLISLKKEGNKANSNKYLIPLICAAICSGGLGVMQKIQQKSEVADQRSAFLVIGLFFACTLSLIMLLISKKTDDDKVSFVPSIFGSLAGLCFGLANMVNVVLASLLSATVLFPVQNIGTILLNTLLGMLIFKEKFKRIEILAFILGILSIIFIVI